MRFPTIQPRGTVVKNGSLGYDNAHIIPPFITHLWVEPNTNEMLSYEVWGDYWSRHGRIPIHLFSIYVQNQTSDPNSCPFIDIPTHGTINIEQDIFDLLNPIRQDLALQIAAEIASGAPEIDANKYGEYASRRLSREIEILKSKVETS